MRSARYWQSGLALGVLGVVAACQSVDAAGSVSVIDELSATCPAALMSSPATGSAPGVEVYREASAWQVALGDAPGADRLAAWQPDFAAGESVLRIDGGTRPTSGWRW